MNSWDKLFSGSSIEEVVRNHQLFLEVLYPGHFQKFKDRLESDSHAAQAEAIVFSYLRSSNLKPSIAEDIASGGIDFLCEPENTGPFLIEVTSLSPEAVSERSGLPNEIDEKVHAFSLITDKLQSAAAKKTKQLSGFPCPRVLGITLTHSNADALFNRLAAKSLLISDLKISVPIGQKAAETKEVTDLKKSAFLRIDKGKIVPIRQSISALLLISIFETEGSIRGVLHPSPAIPFDIAALPEVPFLRLRRWPPENDRLELEWILAHPDPATFHHVPVDLKDDELRKGGP